MQGTYQQDVFDEKQKHRRGYRSLFWPMILIGVGTTWLLYNFGVFTMENIAVAFRLWPVLLVIAGLDLLFGRKSPATGGTLGLVTVGFLLAIMYVGPSIGIGSSVERTNTSFDVPLQTAESLSLHIEAGIEQVKIEPLVDSNQLIEGDIWHVGALDVNVGEDEINKTIDVKEGDDGWSGFTFFTPFEESPGWNFAVNPAVPLALDFEGGIGSTVVDLRGFNLKDVNLNMGIGEMKITLPEPETSYEVTINGGVGEITVDVPDQVAVRLIGSTGVGAINLPANMQKISGDDGFVGEDGTWETSDFESAETRITIHFDGGVGAFNLR